MIQDIDEHAVEMAIADFDSEKSRREQQIKEQ
jgi:hypothetical protein